MKNVLLFLFVAFLFVGCSKDDDAQAMGKIVISHSVNDKNYIGTMVYVFDGHGYDYQTFKGNFPSIKSSMKKKGSEHEIPNLDIISALSSQSYISNIEVPKGEYTLVFYSSTKSNSWGGIPRLSNSWRAKEIIIKNGEAIKIRFNPQKLYESGYVNEEISDEL